MRTVRRASAPCNPSPVLCPVDREDEPTVRELVRDALLLAGFVPLFDFTTADAGLSVLVTLLRPGLLDHALDALVGFDRCGDGPCAVRCAPAGSFAADVEVAA